MTRRYSHGREWWLLAILAVMAGGACNGGRPNVGLDETPPELAFASEVALYTRELSATLARPIVANCTHSSATSRG